MRLQPTFTSLVAARRQSLNDDSQGVYGPGRIRAGRQVSNSPFLLNSLMWVKDASRHSLQTLVWAHRALANGARDEHCR
ncbi:MAG: hypothetical protein ACJA1F_002266 [Paracoccaceae bacterium]